MTAQEALATLIDILLDDGTELTCSTGAFKYIELREHKPVRITLHDTGKLIWQI